MQTDYAPERLHTDVPSKEALLAAAQDGSILQATAAAAMCSTTSFFRWTA